MREIIHEADPEILEEWKRMGTPIWSNGGIVCTGETYKNVVKMTFSKGASLKDASGLFSSLAMIRNSPDVRSAAVGAVGGATPAGSALSLGSGPVGVAHRLPYASASRMGYSGVRNADATMSTRLSQQTQGIRTPKRPMSGVLKLNSLGFSCLPESRPLSAQSLPA